MEFNKSKVIHEDLNDSRSAVVVLVVEDEEVLRHNIAAYLDDCGYSVYTAENGREGIQQYFEIKPDIVITDLKMPVCDGKEVIAEITGFSDITPVIVVSGTGDIAEAIQAMHLGAWDFIMKPVQDMGVIEHALNKALEKSSLLKLNREYREYLEEGKRIADRDMNMAVNVQKNYFPKEPPQSGEWDIAFSFQPMMGVSGDLFDFYMDGTTLSGVALFDVSGHGIASALITMLAKSIFFRHFKTEKNQSLNHVLENINSELIDELENVENYLTGVLLRFTENKIEYVNAAHPGVLIRENSTGDVRYVGNNEHYHNGRFLGIRSLEESYDVMTFDIKPGDSILIYSDCLTDGCDSSEECYGIHNVIKSFRNSKPHWSSEQILEYILEEYYSYCGQNNLMDDLTVILLTRRK